LAKWIPVAVGVGLVLLGLTLDASPKAAENESLGVTIYGQGVEASTELDVSTGHYLVRASGEVEDGQLTMVLRAENLSTIEKYLCVVSAPVDAPDGAWVSGRTYVVVGNETAIRMAVTISSPSGRSPLGPQG